MLSELPFRLVLQGLHDLRGQVLRGNICAKSDAQAFTFYPAIELLHLCPNPSYKLSWLPHAPGKVACPDATSSVDRTDDSH